MSERRPAVVTVGSVHMDLIATADRLPVRGETLPGRAFAMSPGGKGGNQATQAARCGVTSFMVGRVGDDGFGQQLRAALAAKGVETGFLGTDPEALTGVSAVLTGEGGDYASIIVPAAAARLSVADIDAAEPAFAGASMVLLQLEIPLGPSSYAARLAPTHGARIILSAAPAAADMVTLRAAFPDGLDVVIVNAVEAAMLTGIAVDGPHDAPAAGRLLRDRLGAGTVLVTLGGAGVVACGDAGPFHVPAWPVEVVDTIGGGDAFAGTLGAELARGTALADAVVAANAAGALAVTRPGAHDALPSWDEIRTFLAERGAARGMGAEAGMVW